MPYHGEERALAAERRRRRRRRREGAESVPG
jgi:hypothetical protein